MKLPKKVLHVSFNGNLKSPLKPRQPWSPSTAPKDSLFTERLPDRVSFGETVRDCIVATYANYSHYFEDPKYRYPYMDMFVYGAVITKRDKIIDSEVLDKELHDYHITNEVAVLNPVSIDLVGKIRLMNNSEVKSDDIWYHPFDDVENEKVYASPIPRYEILEQYDKFFDLSK